MTDQRFLENVDLAQKLFKVAFVVIFLSCLVFYFLLKNVID